MPEIQYLPVITMPSIHLERFAYAPDGVFGRLTLPNGEKLYTVERPWLGNRPFESCIPDGVYRLQKRISPVVERTSGGEFFEGWEVTDAPERDYIMLHPGNWPENFEGCIGVGDDYTIIEGRNAITNSRDSFRKLMKQLDGVDAWDLVITPFFMEYP